MLLRGCAIIDAGDALGPNDGDDEDDDDDAATCGRRIRIRDRAVDGDIATSLGTTLDDDIVVVAAACVDDDDADDDGARVNYTQHHTKSSIRMPNVRGTIMA